MRAGAVTLARRRPSSFSSSSFPGFASDTPTPPCPRSLSSADAWRAASSPVCLSSIHCGRADPRTPAAETLSTSSNSCFRSNCTTTRDTNSLGQTAEGRPRQSCAVGLTGATKGCYERRYWSVKKPCYCNGLGCTAANPPLSAIQFF